MGCSTAPEEGCCILRNTYPNSGEHFYTCLHSTTEESCNDMIAHTDSLPSWHEDDICIIYDVCYCLNNEEDCLGVCGGNAIEDNNGTCCYTYELDECGICYGNGITCS